jgi:preprotein translocase subunit Sec61beta
MKITPELVIFAMAIVAVILTALRNNKGDRNR